MKIKDYLYKHKYELAFLFLLLCLSLFMMIFYRKESDYFWHIKAGNYMLSNGILKKDVFSWFMRGKYWMSHEWGFDCLIAFLNNVFGNWHLFLYTFFSTLTLIMIMFFYNKKNYLKNIVYSLVWIAGFLIFSFYMQARPHMISFIFVALTIWFLYDLYNNESSKKLYFLPLVTLFWANFHGGSSNLSYLFCFIFLFAGLFKFEFSKIEAKRLSKKQIYKYLIIAIACVITICINPHGIKMISYPYINIFDTTMVSFISEWQPTVLGNPNHYLYFIIVLFVVLTLLFSKEKVKFIDFLLLGISLFLGLKSIRFWGYTYILMSYVVFNYVPKRKIDCGTTRILFLLGLIFVGIFITNFDLVKKEYKKTFISDEMIEKIKIDNPKRLFNMYDYGGELIYNNILVFIDGRADLYSRNNLDDYSKISMLNGDYIKLINKYNFDYFLVMKNYPINMYLKYSDQYEIILVEENAILYRKKDSI